MAEEASWGEAVENWAVCLNTTSLSPVWWEATAWSSPKEGCYSPWAKLHRSLSSEADWSRKGGNLNPYKAWLWPFAFTSGTCFGNQDTPFPSFQKSHIAQGWINAFLSSSFHSLALRVALGSGSHLWKLQRHSHFCSLSWDLLATMFLMSLVQLLTFSLLPTVL